MDTDLIESILKARYIRKGESTFEDICMRVADAISENEKEKEEYYEEMTSLRFLPNSPTLMNAGTDIGQLSACFTIKVEDSIEGIFDALQWGALIHKSGGGTGYNFSSLRPGGACVKSTEGVASGPVSFMKVFNSATETIKQGGRRRGANMGILNVWHPDVLAFIKAKTVEGELSNFNISVMMNNEFMSYVERNITDKVWITHPHTGEDITVGDIWNEIIDGIWRNGEPGVLFYDEINRCNPTPHLGDIDTTNPCGEQPLLHFESCVLGSLNIEKFVKDDAIDYPTLEMSVRRAVRFLDSVIEKNVYPIPQIEESTKRTRKIGLGVMGIHDALLKLKIPYDSAEGRKLCEEVMKAINDTSVEESKAIAAIKGSFPAFEGSIWNEDIRNAAVTTVAPTGTISLIAGCSSGIEPVFSYAYTRKNTLGSSFDIIHPAFERELRHALSMKGHKGDDLDVQVKKVLDHVHETGSVQDVDTLPAEFKRLFKTALDIGWKDHVLMQIAFQNHVHASISKTINMPQSATKDEIAEAVLMAWKGGLKGMTVYRTGSRSEVVLSLKEKEKKVEERPVRPIRPKELVGKTYLCQSGCCSLYITINLLEGLPWEVFIRTVGTSGCEANSNALGRSISAGLQNGVPFQKYVRQLGKVSCISALKNSRSEGISCADIVGKCIDLAAKGISVTTLEDWSIREDKKPKCPDCGEPLDFGEGCNQGICKNCGWSGCS